MEALAIPALILCIILFVLAILMPYYVWLIAHRSRKIEQKIEILTAVIKDASATTLNYDAAQLALSRQTVRAYGHEPEA